MEAPGQHTVAGGLPAVPVRGAQSPCEALGCSACCHDIEMILTEADLGRLRAARPGEDFWMLADDGFLQLRVRDAPAARGGQGRPCWFLGPDGRCTVHEHRPEGCRLYPAVWDEGVRRAVLDEEYCPHTEGFDLQPGLHPAVRALASRLMEERKRRLQGHAHRGPGHG